MPEIAIRENQQDEARTDRAERLNGHGNRHQADPNGRGDPFAPADRQVSGERGDHRECNGSGNGRSARLRKAKTETGVLVEEQVVDQEQSGTQVGELREDLGPDTGHDVSSSQQREGEQRKRRSPFDRHKYGHHEGAEGEHRKDSSIGPTPDRAAIHRVEKDQGRSGQAECTREIESFCGSFLRFGDVAGHRERNEI